MKNPELIFFKTKFIKFDSDTFQNVTCSVHVKVHAYTNHVLQGTRKTRPCINGHPEFDGRLGPGEGQQLPGHPRVGEHAGRLHIGKGARKKICILCGNFRYGSRS